MHKHVFANPTPPFLSRASSLEASKERRRYHERDPAAFVFRKLDDSVNPGTGRSHRPGTFSIFNSR